MNIIFRNIFILFNHLLYSFLFHSILFFLICLINYELINKLFNNVYNNLFLNLMNSFFELSMKEYLIFQFLNALIIFAKVNSKSSNLWSNMIFFFRMIFVISSFSNINFFISFNCIIFSLMLALQWLSSSHSIYGISVVSYAIAEAKWDICRISLNMIYQFFFIYLFNFFHIHFFDILFIFHNIFSYIIVWQIYCNFAMMFMIFDSCIKLSFFLIELMIRNR